MRVVHMVVPCVATGADHVVSWTGWAVCSGMWSSHLTLLCMHTIYSRYSRSSQCGVQLACPHVLYSDAHRCRQLQCTHTCGDVPSRGPTAMAGAASLLELPSAPRHLPVTLYAMLPWSVGTYPHSNSLQPLLELVPINWAPLICISFG